MGNKKTDLKKMSESVVSEEPTSELSEIEKLKVQLDAANQENETLRGRTNTRASIHNGSEEKKRRRKYVGKVRGALDFSDLPEIDPVRFGNKTFRVVNNEGSALYQMIQDGWEAVEIEGSNRIDSVYDFNRGDDTTQQTSRIERHVGVGKSGNDTIAVLMMKDMDWFKDDEIAYHNEQMAEINRSFEQGKNQAEGLDGERTGQVNTYAPYISGTERGMSIQKTFNEG